MLSVSKTNSIASLVNNLMAPDDPPIAKAFNQKNVVVEVPPQERTEFMATCKAAAGFAIEKLNNAAPTIAPGARVRSSVPA